MKYWKVSRIDLDLARSLAVSACLPDLLAVLLVARGMESKETATGFLNPSLKESLRDPFLLPGCRNVSERLFEAILQNKKIAIYGDYDVDGISGVVILYQILKELGGDVMYYIPSRLDEGYGLHEDAVRRLVVDDGVRVIVTVDCGIASIREAEVAVSLGAEILITDHHSPSSKLPPATAIAHPQLTHQQTLPTNQNTQTNSFSLPNNSDNSNSGNSELAERALAVYSFTELCGAAVALKVAWGVCQLAASEPDGKVSSKFRNKLIEMVGIAALGTVADYVRLVDENRAIVRSGLQYLTLPTASVGLRKLLEVCNFDAGKSELNSEFVAFQVVPRLNAVGRLGQAMLAVELLVTEDEPRATELVKYINGLNESRKKIEREILKAAEQQITDKNYDLDAAFVLAGEDWHKGVLGIVAARLADKYHRPAIVFSLPKMGVGSGELVGSARGVSGFDLYAAIKSCGELLLRFGGHANAAGLTLERAKLDDFRAIFCDYVDANIDRENRVAEIFIDGEFPLGAFTKKVVEQIKQLSPFGSGNSKPVFMSKNVYVENVKLMGKDENKKHFSAEFTQNGVKLRGIAFSRSEWVEEMKPYDSPINIAFKVQVSSFNNNIELEIIDWKR
ncbi:MAG: DHH family phosphoesterase [Planctomycetaceae bacterium]|nr:DHH family phosphoesterase [Planctomycetaceae bacterium]